ncbi:Uncharacterised protein [Serratia plymuthica]|uniref:Uncharacterized protein n=1 Tax=Serratia plymuthica TaxID=82996 RepID=A0A2X4XTP1_SERPL|nr:Uncharacterised protein [Serratia plymuthica]
MYFSYSYANNLTEKKGHSCGKSLWRHTMKNGLLCLTLKIFCYKHCLVTWLGRFIILAVRQCLCKYPSFNSMHFLRFPGFQLSVGTFRRQVIQGFIRPFAVIFCQPALCDFPSFIQCSEQIKIQYFCPALSFTWSSIPSFLNSWLWGSSKWAVEHALYSRTPCTTYSIFH